MYIYIKPGMYIVSPPPYAFYSTYFVLIYLYIYWTDYIKQTFFGYNVLILNYIYMLKKTITT